MPIESKLYPRVEKFVRSDFGCNVVESQVGTKLGRIDIVGLREIPGDFESATEIIGIEVKEEHAAFLNSIGQALAYSVYAHNCYLAVRMRRQRHFEPAEMRIAAQFGVGLIEIRAKSMTVVLTSRRFTPEDQNILQIFSKLGVFRCVLCRATYPEKEVSSINAQGEIAPSEESQYLGILAKAIRMRKNAQYWLHELAAQRKDRRRYVYDIRYLCKDCLSIFASLLPKSA